MLKQIIRSLGRIQFPQSQIYNLNIKTIQLQKFKTIQQLNNKSSIYQFTSSSNQSYTQILEQVEATVFQVLKSAAKCKVDKLTKEATFDELGFDSLDGVELVVAMEEHFGFDLSNEDAEKITDVLKAVSIFNKYMVEILNRDKLAEQEQIKDLEKKEDASDKNKQ